jgi:hypothetical protein
VCFSLPVNNAVRGERSPFFVCRLQPDGVSNEVAAEASYVDPGSAAGLRAGEWWRLGRRANVCPAMSGLWFFLVIRRSSRGAVWGAESR